MKHPVWIIGMGMGPADLTEAHRDRIRRADVLVGGRRHLAAFDDLSSEQIEIKGVLATLAEDVARRAEAGLQVVVLASGDPLFHGIGRFLVDRFGSDGVWIAPNITAVGAAFARLRRPWNDVPVVSCHGRSGIHQLLAALSLEPSVAVFTDPDNDPSAIARELALRGLDDTDLWVLERLGSPEEKVRRLTMDQAIAGRFADPNLLVIVQPAPSTAAFGAPEADFVHGDGLITKVEVRAVSLALLRVAPGHTVWDLGAGSGSVALEAALLAWRGRVVAVEKDPARVRMIAANRRRLRRWHVDLVQARLPEGMDDLPRPDRVFVGGGGKALTAILEQVVARMAGDAIVVVNTVLLESLAAARRTLQRLGLATEVIQVQVSRSRATADDERLQAENPVWIVRGSKEA